MQTFLPYPDFVSSLAVLDRQRIGNQIWREVPTLLHGGWSHHPASKMWRDYKPALALYGLFGVGVLRAVYGKDYSDRPWCRDFLTYLPYGDLVESYDQFIRHHMSIINRIAFPPWLGDDAIHSSHRAVLLAKDYDHYSQFGWTETPTPKCPITNKWPYVWPEEK